MNAQEAEIRSLLYPAPGSILRADHLERLAAILEDEKAMAAFDELMLLRLERRRRAGLIWERAAAGELYKGPGEEELVALSSQLAERLEAKVERQTSMPLTLALAFAAGLFLGAVGTALLKSGVVEALLR